MALYGSIGNQHERSGAKKFPSRVLIAILSLALVALVGTLALVKSPATVLSGDAREARPLLNHEATTKIGDVSVDNRIDNGFLDAPLADADHAFCNKDLDPDCENSVNPLFDKEQKGGKILTQSASTAKKPSKSADNAPTHGLSSSAAAKQIASFFGKPSVSREHYKSGQISTKRAAEDLAAYFKDQQALASKHEKAAALHHEKSAMMDTPTKFGLSGDSSRQDLSKFFASSSHPVPPPYVGFSSAVANADLKAYFSTQLHSVEKAHPTRGLSTAAARADLSRYFHQSAPEKATKITPDMIFSRVKDHEASKAKAAPTTRFSSQAAASDLAAFFDSQKPHAVKNVASAKAAAPVAKKAGKQSLAAYGAGVEEDNAVEVGKAYGVSKVLPGPPVFGTNPEPDPKTLDEVNEAINAQRFDGYTNGNGQPVSPIVFPPP